MRVKGEGNMRMVWLLTLIATVVMSHMISAQDESDKWLTAEGIGKTRDEAVQDALRLVIEQGVGVYVQAQSIMVNMEVKEDIVKTITKGYVKRYEVLKEAQEGELYRVHVRAKVADVFQAIDQHFSEAPALYRQLGEPRFLVLLDEEALGQPLRDEHPAEIAIIEALLKEGVRLVDRKYLEKVRGKKAVQALLEGDKKAAWEIGEETGAEILLVGTAKADRFGEFFSDKVQSCHARIEVKAIWVDEGEVLAARRLEKVASAEFQLPTAARVALKKAGEQLITQGFLALIVKAFAIEAAEGRTICLRLKSSYKNLMKLLDIAKRYRGFVDVLRDEYAEEQREGRAWVRVKGNPTDFIRWLLSQPFGQTYLIVVRKSATGRDVTFRIGK